jgi:hypothetical protein
MAGEIRDRPQTRANIGFGADTVSAIWTVSERLLPSRFERIIPIHARQIRKSFVRRRLKPSIPIRLPLEGELVG